MQFRVLEPEEIATLKGPLTDLEAHHNEVAETFSGVYPIMPVDETIEDAMALVRENRARVEILLDDDGNIAGFSNAQHHGENGEINWLYVRDDLRGQGWGKQLFDNALDYLRDHGVHLVDLFVVRGNPAREFYEAAGFEERVAVLSMRL